MFSKSSHSVAWAALITLLCVGTGHGDFTTPADNSSFTGGEPIPISVDIPYTDSNGARAEPGTASLGLDNEAYEFVENIPCDITDVPAASKYVMTPTETYDAPFNTATYILAASCGYDPGDAIYSFQKWYRTINVDYD